MKNPRFDLTHDQTAELLTIWLSIQHDVEPLRNTAILQQLRRAKPILTKRQICFVCGTLCHRDDVVIPEWLLDLLDQSRNVEKEVQK